MASKTLNQTLGHTQIAARIPHAGSMCLLHSVDAWSDTHIECTAISHTDLANPLRQNDASNGVLAPLNLIEYAAQATAVHGSLLQERLNSTDTTPKQGRLVSVRSVELFTNDLSVHAAPLRLRCELLLGDAVSSTFSFTAHSGETLLGQGRASVMLVAQ